MQEALSVLTGSANEAAGGMRNMRTEALSDQHNLMSEPGTAGWILPIVEKKLQRAIQVSQHPYISVCLCCPVACASVQLILIAAEQAQCIFESDCLAAHRCLYFKNGVYVGTEGKEVRACAIRLLAC